MKLWILLFFNNYKIFNFFIKIGKIEEIYIIQILIKYIFKNYKMKLLKIEENDANQRLDKFLKKMFPNATRSLIYKFNRKDKIKIKLEWKDNKFKKKDPEYKLQIWDEVKIFLDDKEFEELTLSLPKQEEEKLWKNKFKEKDIVYEDDYLLVVNKNSWINVHPWDHKTKEISLIEILHDYFWNKLNSLTFKPSLIHRIDRDTSWILMIAKKKDILTKLVNDLKNHNNIKKTYYAIVLWKLDKKKWVINKKLLRVEWAKKENKVQVDEQWQEAITYYKLLKEHIVQSKQWVLIFSELEIQIETWRTHQIRVHLASIWNPILWDKVYWDKKNNSFLSKNFWLTRQALHAWKIKFFHYGIDKQIELTAKIKKDLLDFVDEIKEK